MIFDTNDLGEDYRALLAWLDVNGTEVPSRVGMTREMIAAGIVLRDPVKCIVSRSKFSRTFMNLESTMIAAGSYSDELLRAVTPQAADLLRYETAYGPRVWLQMQSMEEELSRSSTSRRAVVYVGRPYDRDRATYQPEMNAGEMPCTMTWQFLVRHGCLDMIVSMRSWDAVWGLCYDVPCFVTQQMMLASALRVDLGTYYHFAGSFHHYVDRDAEIEARSVPSTAFHPDFSLEKSVEESQTSARQRLREYEKELLP